MTLTLIVIAAVVFSPLLVQCAIDAVRVVRGREPSWVGSHEPRENCL